MSLVCSSTCIALSRRGVPFPPLQADVDRHLRLLCLGLADGLAQALYLKQMQAEVAASEMVMQVSAQVVLLCFCSQGSSK